MEIREIERQQKYVAYSEEEAKDFIEEIRIKSVTDHYRIKKAVYEYKCKKAKGEIVGEAWVVTIVITYGELWEEF